MRTENRVDIMMLSKLSFRVWPGQNLLQVVRDRDEWQKPEVLGHQGLGTVGAASSLW